MKQGGRLGTLFAGALLIALGVSACSSSPTPFESALSSAEEARRAERYDQERHYFEQATAAARTPNEASEARYRHAHTFLREGKPETGALELEQLAAEHPETDRAPRALLDAGRAREKLSQVAQATRNYQQILSKYPKSGVAMTAAKLLVGIRSAQEGKPPSDVWRSLLTSNKDPSLDEGLRYHYGLSLEDESPLKAILAYEDVARHHPLPLGTYTDEALLRSAKLRRGLGDPQGALRTLELLEYKDGQAAIVGTYVRGSYVEALFLRAEIKEVELHDPKGAVLLYQRLASEHPTSRRVDDALFQIVRITYKSRGNACEEMDILRQHAAESRFLRCEGLVCPSLKARTNSSPDATRKCKGWLEQHPSDE